MALSRRCKSSFRKDGHIHFEEIIICHIEKRVLGGDIRLGTEVSTWLHQRFWKDHHLRLAERIPLHKRGQICDGQSHLCNAAPSTGDPVQVHRPDQRGFSFCHATIKSRKQFAARNSHKGDSRVAVWAILFNDGTLKRRGHLIYFCHELWQIPLPSVVYIFVRKILRPPITDFDSQITVICYGSVRRPFFAFSRPGHSCLSYGFRHTLPCIRIAPVSQTVLSHIVLLWLSASSPWSKHRVIICSLF